MNEDNTPFEQHFGGCSCCRRIKFIVNGSEKNLAALLLLVKSPY